MTHSTEKTGKKQNTSHLFQPGQSGNPAGRPKGARHKATMAALQLLEGEAAALTRKAIDEALGGNMVALRLCLERLLPPAREYPLAMDLPEVKTFADLAMLVQAATKGIAEGEMSSSQAVVIGKMVEMHRDVLEMVAIEDRLGRLEDALNEK